MSALIAYKYLNQNVTGDTIIPTVVISPPPGWGKEGRGPSDCAIPSCWVLFHDVADILLHIGTIMMSCGISMMRNILNITEVLIMQLAKTPKEASYNDEKNECQCYTHNSVVEMIPLLFNFRQSYGKRLIWRSNFGELTQNDREIKTRL